MRDNLRRYRAIHQALKQGYPGEPSGRLAQHLTTLAAFISGMVGSKSSQLPSMATKVPERAKPDSRVKRLSRWLDNDAILEAVYCLPYAAMLLHPLACETLVLVMDGSGVGRGCCALMMHVLSQGRALPLAWRVRPCPKGHCPEDLHLAVVALVRELIPEGTKVVFLGDGECDGIPLQETMHEAGWWYACRTSQGNTATWDDETFHVDEVGACLKPGRLIERKAVALTRAAYGPVMRRCCWAQGHAEPLYVVSNRSSAEEAIASYKKRFRIETFFSDQKSRGCNIHKSHLTDPQRLSRL
jgi:hypothetical protein